MARLSADLVALRTCHGCNWNSRCSRSHRSWPRILGPLPKNCETEMIQAHTSIHHHDDTFEVVSNQLHVQNTQTDFASLGLWCFWRCSSFSVGSAMVPRSSERRLRKLANDARDMELARPNGSSWDSEATGPQKSSKGCHTGHSNPRHPKSPKYPNVGWN